MRKRINQEQYLNDKIKDLETVFERKKKKIQDFKKTKSDNEQNYEKLKIDLSNYRRQNANLQDKVLELDKQVVYLKSVKLVDSGTDVSEMTGFFSNFRIQVEQLRDSIDSKSDVGKKTEASDNVMIYFIYIKLIIFITDSYYKKKKRFRT